MSAKLKEIYNTIRNGSKPVLDVPSEWLELMENEEEEKEKFPLAVEPVFVFETLKKRRRFDIQVPFKIKRLLAFLLFLVSSGTVISTMLFRRADLSILFFFIPYTFILLDYLGKTQPNRIMAAYHQLPDIESLDQ